MCSPTETWLLVLIGFVAGAGCAWFATMLWHDRQVRPSRGERLQDFVERPWKYTGREDE